MDITDTQKMQLKQASVAAAVTAPVIPTGATQQALVQPMLAKLNTDLMRSVLKTFSDFNTRYYRSETGAQSSDWLFQQVRGVVSANNRARLNITVVQFKHSFPQNSIIARIEGMSGNAETVIVGAHQDSINQWSPMSGRSPGADDDGSGTVSILEAFRVLVLSGYQPLRPVEFHWYAGEEAGLLGSQAIVQSYSDAGRQVAGMMQMDMTMYPTKSHKDIGLVTDYTDASLTSLLEALIPVYTSLPYGEFECGYGCSDHASWNNAGFRAAIPFESSNMHENELIHSDQDAYDTVDFDHGLEFSKLAVGFVVEMSHK